MVMHLIILIIIILLIGGGARLTRASRGLGEGVRNFKKGLRGEGDIDITDTVKRIEDEDEGKS
jgi:sec-independent protein translocase protein TatA